MARCPSCWRRLAAGAVCTRDGGRAADEPQAEDAAPAIAGAVVHERIGAGGYATAWAATTANMPAVVKVAHRDSARAGARLAREYDVLGRLAGARVPTPIALGRTADGRPFVAMSRQPGETLAHRLAGAAPLDLPDAIAITEAICDALAGVHERGYTHGDLKPENVLIAAGPVASLIDLGSARGGDLDDAALAGVGTIEYMAPEQLGDEVVDPRADVYAVGAILFELVTGRPPFAGERDAVMFALRNQRAPRLGSFAGITVLPAIEALVAACLAKEPSERPADAAAIVRGLRATEPRPAIEPAQRFAEPRERATCGLLALAASSSASDAIAAFGGVLSRRTADHVVFVFAAGGRLPPLHAAVRAAEAASESATVHVATLALRRRTDGTTAYFGEALENVGGWAEDGGITYTREARAALLHDELGPRPLIGRDDIGADLDDRIARAVAGGGAQLAVVCADAGLGKSALLAALTRTRPGVRWISLVASAPAVAGPSDLARELLERAPTAPELDAFARDVAAWTLDPARPLPPSPAPDALRAALARAIASALATTIPTVLVIDDAHLADDAVLDGIASALRTSARAPLGVVLAGRPLLRESPALAGRDVIELGPLAPDHAARLCRLLLAPIEVVPELLVERLCSRTHGRPLELVELVAGLRRDGAIVQSERGRWELDAHAIDFVPESHLLRWFAERTLADLPRPLRAHAALAHLLGGHVEVAHVRAVLDELDRRGASGPFPLDAARGLELLRDAGVLVRSRDSYEFRHPALAALASGDVDPALAREVHTAAWLAWSRRADLPFEVRLERCAAHADDAAVHGVSARLHRDLALIAAARHRHAAAAVAWSRAIAAGTHAPGTIDVAAAHWRRAIARYRFGRHDAAAEDFELARAAAVATADRAREAEILLDHAMSLDWAVEYRASAALVDLAAALLDEGSPPHLRAYLAVSQARSLIRDGHETAALDPLLLAITLATPLGDVAYESLVVALLQSAPILATVGRHAEARERFDRVLALTAAKGDRMHRCAALANRLWRPFATPDVALLTADYEEVLEIARELGHFVMEFTAEVNFAGALHHLGVHEPALAHARTALALEQSRLGDAARPEAALLEVRILAAAARCEEAARAVAAIERHQQRARGDGRHEAVFAPAELLLLDGVRIACDLPPTLGHAELLARGAEILPRHELAELRALLAR